MEKLDYKKQYRSLYVPKGTPSLITVPPMQFLMVDGKGNPNETDGEYQSAVEILYTLSYAIKMNKTTVGYRDYTVFPLEGLWSVDTAAGRDGTKADFTQKSRFCWTSLIRQPDFVTADVFAQAIQTAQKKKPYLVFEKARFATFDEGLCEQCLHTGSYDDEPVTLSLMETFMTAQSLVSDVGATRRHHEIYLNDPRRTAAEKRKTVLRIPVIKSQPSGQDTP